MVHKFALAALALLSLAACNDPRFGGGYDQRTGYAPGYSNGYAYDSQTGTTYDTRGAVVGNGSSLPPSYGAQSPRANALQGCASGQPSDFLHQNRPGGSDYNPERCGYQGY